MAMKDFLKKMSNQDEAEDLNTGYNNDYYDGAYNEPSRWEDSRRSDDRRPDSRYDSRSGSQAGQSSRLYEERNAHRGGDTYGEYDRRDRRPAQDDRGRYQSGGYSEPAYAGRRQGYGYDEDDGRDRYYQPDEEKPRRRTAVVAEPEPVPENAGTLYFAPDTYKDDREAIADGLRESHVVVISVAKLIQSDIVRLSDFVLGVSLALEGNLYRLNRTTIVIGPKGVEVDPDELELPDEDEEEADSVDECSDEDSEEDGTDDN